MESIVRAIDATDKRQAFPMPHLFHPHRITISYARLPLGALMRNGINNRQTRKNSTQHLLILLFIFLFLVFVVDVCWLFYPPSLRNITEDDNSIPEFWRILWGSWQDSPSSLQFQILKDDNFFFHSNKKKSFPRSEDEIGGLESSGWNLAPVTGRKRMSGMMRIIFRIFAPDAHICDCTQPTTLITPDLLTIHREISTTFGRIIDRRPRPRFRNGRIASDSHGVRRPLTHIIKWKWISASILTFFLLFCLGFWNIISALVFSARLFRLFRPFKAPLQRRPRPAI